MKNRWLLFLEKFCIAGIIVSLAVIVCGGLYLYRSHMEAPEEQSKELEEELLTDGDYFLPENLYLGQKLPYTLFSDQEGGMVDLAESCAGDKTVLMYWGSWCTYCEKQLEHLEEFRKVAEEQDVRLILVNKTDPEKKETVKRAEAWLAEKGIDQERVYDTELAAYHAYGMKRIPTAVVLDEEGYVRALKTGVLESGEALTELLDFAERGNSPALLRFLETKMTDERGGIYTGYQEAYGTASPAGHDVLSESMGLMMECAVALGDRPLFDQAWAFAQSMQVEGVFAWYITADGVPAGATAALDDLRIALALAAADEKWGGYGDALSSLCTSILETDCAEGRFASFYDFNMHIPGNSISLTYGDIAGLRRLTEYDPEFEALAEQMQAIVENGYISDEFPLYYAGWDYEKQEYTQDSLNTAEAVLTLYHLAQAGLLRDTSLDWLRERLEKGDLAARYFLDGTPVPGYSYESTAVYAICAMTAAEAGDVRLYKLAHAAMEKSRVTDPESPFFGSFSYNADGAEFASFDQLTPLWVYANHGRIKFN